LRWWRARLDAADERTRRSRSRRQTDNGKIESNAAEQRDFDGTVQRRDRLDHIVEVRGVVDATLPGGVYWAGVGERQKADESKKECRRPHTLQTVTAGPDKSVMTTARAPLLKTHRLHLAVASGSVDRDPHATSWKGGLAGHGRFGRHNEDGGPGERKDSSLLPNC